MTMHVDGSRNHHVFTIVYTLRSHDCRGGSVTFSDNAEGYMDAHHRCARTFTPPDNSVYFFPGGHVEHMVTHVTQGTRFAIILLAEWSDILPIQIIRYWTKNEAFVCEQCLRVFKREKYLKAHKNKKSADGVKTYCSTLDPVVVMK
jgi:hypothetical protein